MNSNIRCPKCSGIIENEKFDFRLDSDAPWYKFTKTTMYCPHCGTRLKYEIKTQLFIYLTGIAFLFSAVLVFLKLIPPYAIVFVPLVLALIFWKIRKLCIY